MLGVTPSRALGGEKKKKRDLAESQQKKFATIRGYNHRDRDGTAEGTRQFEEMPCDFKRASAGIIVEINISLTNRKSA